MMEKVTKQQYVDICTIPFQNDDPINTQIVNTGNIPVPLHPKNALHSVIYPIS